MSGDLGHTGRRVAERMPRWFGSIRVRLTVVYSILLFGLAAVVVGGIYFGLSRSLDDEPVSRREPFEQLIPIDGNFDIRITGERTVIDGLAYFESQVNKRALVQLRTYSFSALGLLFLGSLIVGWHVAGMVMRPIGHITGVANEIQATDLSRRIGLQGPNDELRQLADTFDDMLARLDTAFEGQRRFIHEASHELRNPLAVIRTNIDVVASDPAATTEELRAVTEVVGRSAERMSTLVDDLLLHARHEVPARRVETVDLAMVTEDTVAEFQAVAAARGVTIEHEADRDLLVRGDGGGLRRAVANLLANAVRVSDPGATVSVRAGADGELAWASVADEGPGIAEKDHARVFQRFWRGDQAKARAEGRSGLGLTIVRQIVEGHRGEVTLRSTLGEGATFTIWLPRHVEESPDADPGVDQAAGQPARPKPSRRASRQDSSVS